MVFNVFVILSIGMALVISSDAGTGPNDLVAVILTDKLKRFQFRTVRICCDLFFIITGFLLGGTVGIGTVAAAFLVGPVVQIFRPIHERAIQRILEKKSKESSYEGIGNRRGSCRDEDGSKAEKGRQKHRGDSYLQG